MSMLFVITNNKSCKEDFLTRIERIASANPYRIILREKHLSQDDLLELAIKCKEICDKYSVAFSVNSNIEVAHKVNADIHLPYKLFVENNENIKDFSTIGVSIAFQKQKPLKSLVHHILLQDTSLQQIARKVLNLVVLNIFQIFQKPLKFLFLA